MIFRTDKPSFFRGFNEESESRLFLKRLETFWIRAARASDWHLVFTTPFFFLWKTQSFPYSTTSVIGLADTTNYDRLLDSCYLTLFSSLFEKSCKKSRARGTTKETALPTDQVTSMPLLRAFSQNSLCLPLGTTPTNFTRNKLCYRLMGPGYSRLLYPCFKREVVAAAMRW